MRGLRASIFAVLLAAAALGCGRTSADRDVLFQASTLDALLEGAYDGELTCAQLKAHGDFGLGTFDALDGEMVVLDGVVHQVKADGKVYRPDGNTKTPFAAVTFFEAETHALLRDASDLDALTRTIDEMLPTKNVPWAVKVTGEFEHVRTRSVPRQERPYRRLAEVTRDQPTFEFHDVAGTLVGFRLPEYVRGLNVPGYHLHFLTADGTRGGHVLKLRTKYVRIELDACSSLTVALPRTAAFEQADLSGERTGELEAVEK